MKTTLINKDSRMGRPSASGIFRLAQCPGSWLAEMCIRDSYSSLGGVQAAGRYGTEN